MKNKKVLLYLSIAVVIFILIAVVGKKAGWFGGGNLLKVSTEFSQKRKIVEIITANGKIQPETEVRLSPDVSGEIVELTVKEGDEVEKGDLLIKIKPDIYLSAIERIEASVNSSKANLANAKARLMQVEAQFKQAELSFNRNKKLWETKAISQAEYEQALSTYEVSKADIKAARETANAALYAVKSSEASLKEARENLSKTTIYAPINGTVSKLNVEIGERVVGTVQMTGTELLRIANLNMMEVKVDVNENDIVSVSLNDTAIIEVDAYMDEKFKGIVTEIANSANTVGQATEQVTNFEVKIRILHDSYKHLLPENNPNYYPFRPGMSATADIQTNTKYNVISVPIQAVTTRADSSGVSSAKSDVDGMEVVADNQNASNQETDEEEELKEVVFVFSNNKVEMQEVTTGIQDNQYIEITNGIMDSVEIVTAPYNAISRKLKNNMAVQKVKKEELFQVKK